MGVVLKGLVGVVFRCSVGVVLRGSVGVVLRGSVGVVLRGSVGVVLRGSVGVFSLESGKTQRKTIDSCKIQVLNTNTHYHVCCAYTWKYQTQHTKYIHTCAHNAYDLQ